MVDRLNNRNSFFDPDFWKFFQPGRALTPTVLSNRTQELTGTVFDLGPPEQIVNNKQEYASSFQLRDLTNQNLQDQQEISLLQQTQGVINSIFDATIELKNEVIQNRDANDRLQNQDAVKLKLSGTIQTVNDLSNDAISKGWTTANDLNSANLGLDQLNPDDYVTNINSRIDAITDNLALGRKFTGDRIALLRERLEERQNVIAKLLRNREESTNSINLAEAVSISERLRNQFSSSNSQNLIQAFSLNSIQPNQVFGLLSG